VVVALLLVAAWLLRRRRRVRRPEPAGTTLHRPAAPTPSPPPPPPAPVPAPAPEAAEAAPRVAAHEHEWDVAYDRGSLGQDGVWRFPHRCRVCGIELLARDVADASAQAPRTGEPPRADA
jgi:hypothetical protein